MFSKIKQFLFENRSQKQTIAKNTVWLFSGQIGGRLLRTALVIFAARILGPESWGAFSYATTLVAFLLIFSDIGISAIVTRESARDITASNRYFSTAFFLKSGLLVVCGAALMFLSPYLTTIPETRALLPIIALLLIFDSLRNFGFAISRAMESMQWEALNEILTNAFITGVGFYALLKSPTSTSLAYAYVIGTGIGLLFILAVMWRYVTTLISHFDASLIKPILSSSLPFAFASFLGAIMINTDLIMLGWMRTPAEIGYYSAAQKPIQLLYTLAALFAASMFPVLSKLSSDEHTPRFRSLLEKSAVASLFVAIPTAIVGLPLSTGIITLLYGAQYLPAIGSFQVLLPTLLIIFPSVIVSNALLSRNQQKKFIQFSLIGAIGNVIFNFLLIPVWGIVGCSLSTLVTQILANAFIWNKMDSVVPFKVANKLGKILLASLISAAAVVALSPLQWPVLVLLALAIVIYFTALIILKEPSLSFASDLLA
ncbi:MAG: flippase [Patescibacteria group bacterium]|nr:flippase [Patescibacteria group bacterium]